MSASLLSNNNLFQKGYTNLIRIELDITRSQFPFPGLILADFIKNFSLPLPEELSFFSTNPGLSNVRGQQSPGITDKETILSLTGSSSSEDQIEPINFKLFMKTSFDKFVGKTEINYNCFGEGSSLLGETLPNLTLEQACSIVPLDWENARFGIEMFRKSFFGSMLGTAPIIFKRLYIEISKSKIEISGEESYLEDKNSLPLEKEDFLVGLLKTLNNRQLADEKTLLTLQGWANRDH